MWNIYLENFLIIIISILNANLFSRWRQLKSFTMYRPRVHSVSQWWKQHIKRDDCISWPTHSITSTLHLLKRFRDIIHKSIYISPINFLIFAHHACKRIMRTKMINYNVKKLNKFRIWSTRQFSFPKGMNTPSIKRSVKRQVERQVAKI